MNALALAHTEAIRPQPPPRHPRSGARRAVGHALVLARRHMLHLLLAPGAALWLIVQPIMFLLLFNFMFSGVISDDTGDYIQFLLPGIVVQFLMFITFGTAIGMHTDLSSGIVDRLRSLPVARSAVLSGRIIIDALRGALNIVVLVTAGTLLGFRFSTGAMAIAGAFLLATAFGIAMSWVGAWIGLAVRDTETVGTVATIWVVPLMFLSSLLVPTRTLPGWLQVFVTINPLTSIADALRALTRGGPTTTPVLASLAWTIGIIIVFSTLAVRQYRRIE